MSLSGYNKAIQNNESNQAKTVSKGGLINQDSYVNVGLSAYNKDSPSDSAANFVYEYITPSGTSASVYNFQKVRHLYRAAESGLVDHIYIGDSNFSITNPTVNGYVSSMSRRLFEYYGMYGSETLGVQTNGGNGHAGSVKIGSMQQYTATAGFKRNVARNFFFSSGCPYNSLTKYYWQPSYPTEYQDGMGGYGWLPSGYVASGTVAYFGNTMASGSFIDYANEPLTFYARYGVFNGQETPVAGSGGKGVWNARKDNIAAYQSSWTYVTGSVFSYDPTFSGTDPILRTFTGTIPTGNRYNDLMQISLEGYPTFFGLPYPIGPFFLGWQKIVQPEKTSGIACTRMWSLGSSTFYHFLTGYLLNKTPDHMTEYFNFMTSTQKVPKSEQKCVINLLHMGNDFVTSAAFYQGSLATGITRFKNYWASGGYEPENLGFILGGYHPNNYALESHIQACKNLSDIYDNVAVVDTFQLATTGNFLTSGWYNGSDEAHLNTTGYYYWGNLVVDALVNASRINTLPVGNTYYFARDNAIGTDLDTINIVDIVPKSGDGNSQNRTVTIREIQNVGHQILIDGSVVSSGGVSVTGYNTTTSRGRIMCASGDLANNSTTWKMGSRFSNFNPNISRQERVTLSRSITQSRAIISGSNLDSQNGSYAYSGFRSGSEYVWLHESGAELVITFDGEDSTWSIELDSNNNPNYAYEGVFIGGPRINQRGYILVDAIDESLFIEGVGPGSTHEVVVTINPEVCSS